MTDRQRALVRIADEPVPEVGDAVSLPATRGRRRGRLRVLLASTVFIGVMLLLGQLLSVSTLFTMKEALVMAVFAVATNLLIGYGGMVSFGQAAFFGAGSYTVALGWLHWHWSFWLSLAMSPLVGAVLALLVGLVALRSRRLYFALLTLAFSQLFYVLAEERYNFTQGANGIVGPMLPSRLLSSQTSYLFVLVASTICVLLLWKITASPFGLVLRAIRENRERMEALGVNVFGHQLMAFVISGAFCSVAGALFVVYSQSAYPELLDWTQSGYAVFMVVIGGMFAFLGPVLGAFVYVFGNQTLVSHTKDWELVLGAVLVLIVLFRPDGLASLLSRRRWTYRRRKAAAGERENG
jgi:branched-chain amino acid transport system permease protein